MHRIDTATRAVNLFGAGKDGFTDGVPSVTPATFLDAAWFNEVQEEVARTVEHAGQPLAPLGTYNQLSKAVAVGVANWTLKSSTPTHDFRGCAAGYNTSGSIALPRFVGVGFAAEIFTSMGGETWTSETAGGAYAGDFYAVGFDGNTSLHANSWVAVGTAGGIETSDGSGAWTKRTPAAAFAGTFEGVAFGAGLWVIVGSTGEIQTSPDGVTWTHRANAGAYAGDFQALIFGGGLFVAVGTSGEIQTSTNGTSWTHRGAASAFAGDFVTVAYSSQAGVYVASSNTYAAHAVQFSADGVTWTSSTDFGDTGDVIVAGESPYLLLATDSATVSNLYYSTDGNVWSPLFALENASHIHSLSYGFNRWLALDASGKIYASLRTQAV